MASTPNECKSESPRLPGEDPCPPARPRRVGWRRALVAGYLLLLHAVLILIVCEPEFLHRARKFVLKSPTSMPEYRGMVTAHADLTRLLPEGAVVFVGDSRMRGLDAAAAVDEATAAGGRVYNLSIGGDTTEGLRSRLPRYSRLDRCRLVVLGVGVNDLSHYADEEILRNYEGVVTWLRGAGVREVAVCAVLPIDEATYRQANSAWFRGHRTTNGRIGEFNRKLRELCGRHPGVRFTDTTADLSDPSGNLRAGFATDGLHLSEEGNRAWAAALRRALPLPGGRPEGD